MTTLRIEHAVADFDAWKRAFDSDPLQREKSGVLRYRVWRSFDDPNYVIVDLEFDGKAAAEAFLSRLQALWSRVDVMREPRARMLATVETVEYGGSGTWW